MKMTLSDTRLSKAVKTCRACKGKKLVTVLDLGKTPLANSFIRSKELGARNKERFFELRVLWCKNCTLLQLSQVVNPKIMFSNYLYVSSTSPANVAHFERLAKKTCKLVDLKRNSKVVDIGSNDGILLKPFKRLGMKVLGVEPAKNIAKLANKMGIKTEPVFFSLKEAGKLKNKYGQVDLISTTNVFAHVDNWTDFVKGVKTWLKDNGVFVIEVPYIIDFINKNLFDTVYHEHLSYVGVTPLTYLFKRLGMQIFAVRKSGNHGGSIQVFVKNKNDNRKVDASVNYYLKREKQLGLDKKSVYAEFEKRVKKNKKELVKLLNQLKAQKKTVAGYGASAKGNTLLNYFNINNSLLNFIVDDSRLKQNLHTPGTHIKVLSPEALYTKRPDYALLLAWNFASPIMKIHKKYKKRGGKFILPFPKVKIV